MQEVVERSLLLLNTSREPTLNSYELKERFGGRSRIDSLCSSESSLPHRELEDEPHMSVYFE